MTDMRDCKFNCIDAGNKFCASPDYSYGNCCGKNENCSLSAECSD